MPVILAMHRKTLLIPIAMVSYAMYSLPCRAAHGEPPIVADDAKRPPPSLTLKPAGPGPSLQNEIFLEDYHTSKKKLTSGWIVFGAIYGVSVLESVIVCLLTAMASGLSEYDDGDEDDLSSRDYAMLLSPLIPVAGPFVRCAYWFKDDSNLFGVFDIFMGIGQIAGLALLIDGHVARRRIIGKLHAAMPDTSRSSSGRRTFGICALPYATTSGMGIGLVGYF